MNIYTTDSDPVIAAQNLDDKRLSKSILEVAQILSTACSETYCWKSNLYAPTARTHPCVIWAKTSRGNFNWLVLYGLALNEEFKYRFGSNKERSTSVILSAVEAFKGSKLDATGMTPFPNLTGLSGNIGTVKLYRQFMIQSKWNDESIWTKRGRPQWAPMMKRAA